MKTSTLFSPTGASPSNFPSAIFETLGASPSIPKWISPVGTGLPSMLTVPFTLAIWIGGGPLEQPELTPIARPRQTASASRFMARHRFRYEEKGGRVKTAASAGGCQGRYEN